MIFIHKSLKVLIFFVKRKISTSSQHQMNYERGILGQFILFSTYLFAVSFHNRSLSQAQKTYITVWERVHTLGSSSFCACHFH